MFKIYVTDQVLFCLFVVKNKFYLNENKNCPLFIFEPTDFFM